MLKHWLKEKKDHSFKGFPRISMLKDYQTRTACTFEYIFLLGPKIEQQIIRGSLCPSFDLNKVDEF